jgi:hypothetical protein
MAVADYLLDGFLWIGEGKIRSATCALLYSVFRNGVAAPLSSKLLQHYVEGSGEPYRLENIPDAWQHWIVAEVRRRHLATGRPHEMKAYHHRAPYDLRHTLGTFSLQIVPAGGRGRRYLLSDMYQFEYDCTKRDPTTNRHGLLLQGWSDQDATKLASLLPARTYKHRCGFHESFALEKQKEGYFLLIPQQVLAEIGRKFPVTGEFTRQ